MRRNSIWVRVFAIIALIAFLAVSVLTIIPMGASAQSAQSKLQQAQQKQNEIKQKINDTKAKINIIATLSGIFDKILSASLCDYTYHKTPENLLKKLYEEKEEFLFFKKEALYVQSRGLSRHTG